MAVRYKITATINKSGGSPTYWTRYSAVKMTRAECDRMLSRPERGRSRRAYDYNKVTVESFRCEEIIGVTRKHGR
ncbi:DUF1187 family protein [Siccibacter turicensis]|uniref:DUF1187 family protein n=1 Tax=Siccibacter turicensis TaxID=357233 RepID=UPI00101E90D0|nr:DUF1187 family protein [Siccibacter turicensis]